MSETLDAFQCKYSISSLSVVVVHVTGSNDQSDDCNTKGSKPSEAGN